MKQLASIIDVPQKTLNSRIWGFKDDEYFLKPHIQSFFLETLFNILKDNGYVNPEQWIKEFALYGSNATYQYSDTTDIDIGYIVDIGQYNKANNTNYTFDKIFDILHNILLELPDIKLENSEHLVTYYPITEYPDSDALYSITKEKWIKKPPIIPESFNPTEDLKESLDKAQQWAKILDLKLVETQKDFKEFKSILDKIKSLSNEEQQDLKELFTKQLKLITEHAKELVDIYKKIKSKRKKAFMQKVLPDPKKYYFSKSWHEDNIVYKYLEKRRYLRLLINLKKFLEKRI